MPNKIIPEARHKQMCDAFKSENDNQIMDEINALAYEDLLTGTASNGHSLLMSAAACKSLNAIKLLLFAEPDLKYQNGNETVLTVAIAQDAIDIVKFLIKIAQMQPSSHDKELATRLIKEGKISDRTTMQELLAIPSTQIASSSVWSRSFYY